MNLDRGLVAAPTADGVFLSWRLLGEEVTGSSPTGLSGHAFHVYRGRKLIATVTDSTNYLDRAGAGSDQYRVVSVARGRERDRSQSVAPWSQNHVDLPLQRPADGVTPAGESYTYAANDMSVGDVDGDGTYEYVVKWDPSNSKDVSQVGYTGPVFVDTYRADGTLLNRISLGVNIRAGAHYTQFLVYDFDGDGRSEMMLKTAPGTKTTRYDGRGQVVSERYVTLPRRDRRAGYSHDDDYRLSKAGYYDHLVELFQGWRDHPEVRADDGRRRSRRRLASPLGTTTHCRSRTPRLLWTTSSTSTLPAGALATSSAASRASSSTVSSTSPCSTAARVGSCRPLTTSPVGTTTA